MPKTPVVEKDRKQWDAVMRREAAEQILESADPRQTFRELSRRYRLQPYQLYAWVGQAAIARRQKQTNTTLPADIRSRPAKSLPVGRASALPKAVSLEDAMAIAQFLADRRSSDA